MPPEIKDPFSTWYSQFIEARRSAPPCARCQSGPVPTSLCTPCYLEHRSRLYSDLPRELKRLWETRGAILGLSEGSARDLCTLARGGAIKSALRGEAAALLNDVKRCQEGPYGQSMELILAGIERDGLPKKGGRHADDDLR
jgi:hypothetical protein